ncbi:unnamed protein product [Amoebophrya sp. A120]|nr:unnamed protein product [Amoebophrya sp. A120]|eukprot:GSA120T00025699001.1
MRTSHAVVMSSVPEEEELPGSEMSRNKVNDSSISSSYVGEEDAVSVSSNEDALSVSAKRRTKVSESHSSGLHLSPTAGGAGGTAAGASSTSSSCGINNYLTETNLNRNSGTNQYHTTTETHSSFHLRGRSSDEHSSKGRSSLQEQFGGELQPGPAEGTTFCIPSFVQHSRQSLQDGFNALSGGGSGTNFTITSSSYAPGTVKKEAGTAEHQGAYDGNKQKNKGKQLFTATCLLMLLLLSVILCLLCIAVYNHVLTNQYNGNYIRRSFFSTLNAHKKSDEHQKQGADAFRHAGSSSSVDSDVSSSRDDDGELLQAGRSDGLSSASSSLFGSSRSLGSRSSPSQRSASSPTAESTLGGANFATNSNVEEQEHQLMAEGEPLEGGRRRPQEVDITASRSSRDSSSHSLDLSVSDLSAFSKSATPSGTRGTNGVGMSGSSAFASSPLKRSPSTQSTTSWYSLEGSQSSSSLPLAALSEAEQKELRTSSGATAGIASDASLRTGHSTSSVSGSSSKVPGSAPSSARAASRTPDVEPGIARTTLTEEKLLQVPELQLGKNEFEVGDKKRNNNDEVLFTGVRHQSKIVPFSAMLNKNGKDLDARLGPGTTPSASSTNLPQLTTRDHESPSSDAATATYYVDEYNRGPGGGLQVDNTILLTSDSASDLLKLSDAQILEQIEEEDEEGGAAAETTAANQRIHRVHKYNGGERTGVEEGQLLSSATGSSSSSFPSPTEDVTTIPERQQKDGSGDDAEDSSTEPEIKSREIHFKVPADHTHDRESLGSYPKSPRGHAKDSGAAQSVAGGLEEGEKNGGSLGVAYEEGGREGAEEKEETTETSTYKEPPRGGGLAAPADQDTEVAGDEELRVGRTEEKLQAGSEEQNLLTKTPDDDRRMVEMYFKQQKRNQEAAELSLPNQNRREGRSRTPSTLGTYPKSPRRRSISTDKILMPRSAEQTFPSRETTAASDTGKRERRAQDAQNVFKSDLFFSVLKFPLDDATELRDDGAEMGGRKASRLRYRLPELDLEEALNMVKAASSSNTAAAVDADVGARTIFQSAVLSYSPSTQLSAVALAPPMPVVSTTSKILQNVVVELPPPVEENETDTAQKSDVHSGQHERVATTLQPDTVFILCWYLVKHEQPEEGEDLQGAEERTTSTSTSHFPKDHALDSQREKLPYMLIENAGKVYSALQNEVLLDAIETSEDAYPSTLAKLSTTTEGFDSEGSQLFRSEVFKSGEDHEAVTRPQQALNTAVDNQDYSGDLPAIAPKTVLPEPEEIFYSASSQLPFESVKSSASNPITTPFSTRGGIGATTGSDISENDYQQLIESSESLASGRKDQGSAVATVPPVQLGGPQHLGSQQEQDVPPQMTQFLGNVVRKLLQDVKQAVKSERNWQSFDLTHAATRPARLKQLYAVFSLLPRGKYDLRLHFDSFDKEPSSEETSNGLFGAPQVGTEGEGRREGVLSLQRGRGDDHAAPSGTTSAVTTSSASNGALDVPSTTAEEVHQSFRAAKYLDVSFEKSAAGALSPSGRNQQTAGSTFQLLHHPAIEDDRKHPGSLLLGFSFAKFLKINRELSHMRFVRPGSEGAGLWKIIQAEFFGAARGGDQLLNGGANNQVNRAGAASSITATNSNYLSSGTTSATRDGDSGALSSSAFGLAGASHLSKIMQPTSQHPFQHASRGSLFANPWHDDDEEVDHYGASTGAPAFEQHDEDQSYFHRSGPSSTPSPASSATTPLVSKVEILRKHHERATSNNIKHFDNFEIFVMADNGSNGSVDTYLGTQILETYIQRNIPLYERLHKLPALQFPEVLPPDGACFGIVLAFLLTSIRNYAFGAQQPSPQLAGTNDIEGKSTQTTKKLSTSSSLFSPEALNRFQSPNMLHRTLQAVFESVIYFDRAREKKIGSHYGRIINGLSSLFGFEIGAPKTYFLAEDPELLQPQVGGSTSSEDASERRTPERTKRTSILQQVFTDDIQDGLYVFTIGKDGDQHATAIAKVDNQILWLEPNQGLIFFETSAADKLKPYIQVYENLASKDGFQRHRGKLYPVRGIAEPDLNLLQLAERANERP